MKYNLYVFGYIIVPKVSIYAEENSYLSKFIERHSLHKYLQMFYLILIHKNIKIPKTAQHTLAILIGGSFPFNYFLECLCLLRKDDSTTFLRKYVNVDSVII